MTAGQVFYGGLTLITGAWMVFAVVKALRTGRVLVGESSLANSATREDQPALYWLMVIALIIGAVVAIAAGACAFLLWGPK